MGWSLQERRPSRRPLRRRCRKPLRRTATCPSSRFTDRNRSSCFLALGDAPPPETLTRWMETVLALQRSDAGPTEFYAQAAQALVDMIGLDVGLVLLHGDKGWQVAARAAREDGDDRPAGGGREFSQTVLRQVLAEKQTFYQDLALMKSQESLKSVDAVVVSPIFGLQDEVVGALYGLRRGHGRIKGVQDPAAGGAAGAAAGRRRRRQPGPHGRHPHPHPVRAVLLAGAGARAGTRPGSARGPRPGSDHPDERPARLLRRCRSGSARRTPAAWSAT